MKNGLISSLPFRVNGYVFKCLEAASYDILYIFPECRNKQPDDESPKNGGNTGSTNRHEVKNSISSNCQEVGAVQSQVKQKIQQSHIPEKGKNEAKFLMKKTEFPDVYEIYMFDSSNAKKAKVGYAGIPNIECSVMVKNWFIDKDEIYAKCKKNPVNEKWIPVQLM